MTVLRRYIWAFCSGSARICQILLAQRRRLRVPARHVRAPYATSLAGPAQKVGNDVNDGLEAILGLPYTITIVRRWGDLLGSPVVRHGGTSWVPALEYTLAQTSGPAGQCVYKGRAGVREGPVGLYVQGESNGGLEATSP